MPNKEEWKKTGKSLGCAFKGFGKTIVKSARYVVDKADNKINDKVDEDIVIDNESGKEINVFNDGSWREVGKEMGEAFGGLGKNIGKEAKEIFAGDEDEKKTK